MPCCANFRNFVFTSSILPIAEAVETLFRDGNFGPVVHLAAQAGVRYSLENPHAYLDANLAGFLNVLEGCRHRRTEHLVFASSSSVYGANTRLPFSVHDNVDHPISLYAATKKANELMAHAYSHLYGLPATGLRFFTVYGPWGRPDMAMFIFAKAIAEGRPIKLFNYGRARRDFTYIDDVIEAVERLIDKVPAKTDAAASGAPDPATSTAPWRIYNIGNNRSIEISHLVALTGGRIRPQSRNRAPADAAGRCRRNLRRYRRSCPRRRLSPRDGNRRRRAQICRLVSRLLSAVSVNRRVPA